MSLLLKAATLVSIEEIILEAVKKSIRDCVLQMFRLFKVQVVFVKARIKAEVLLKARIQ